MPQRLLSTLGSKCDSVSIIALHGGSRSQKISKQEQKKPSLCSGKLTIPVAEEGEAKL